METVSQGSMCRKENASLGCTHGAALVSSRIWRSLSSCGLGRDWRCFSREFWRTWLGLMGEMGEESTRGSSAPWVDMVG